MAFFFLFFFQNYRVNFFSGTKILLDLICSQNIQSQRENFQNFLMSALLFSYAVHFKYVIKYEKLGSCVCYFKVSIDCF